MKEHYDFEDIEDEEETESQRRIKKISKYVIGAMLILMMLSFVVPFDVIFSLLESDKVKDGQIQLTDNRVLFKPEVLDELKEHYKANQMTEIKICLTGYIEEKDYKITGFYSPKTYFKTPISIRSDPCNDETIISMHTHPFRNCLFSYQDIVSYNYYKRINPKAMTAVMCDIDRFAFYSG